MFVTQRHQYHHQHHFCDYHLEDIILTCSNLLSLTSQRLNEINNNQEKVLQNENNLRNINQSGYLPIQELCTGTILLTSSFSQRYPMALKSCRIGNCQILHLKIIFQKFHLTSLYHLSYVCVSSSAAHTYIYICLDLVVYKLNGWMLFLIYYQN